MRTFSLLEKIEARTKNWPIFLLILLFLVLVLRLPSLFEPFWYGDEGIYLTLGQAIRQGQTLYLDIHDNKPPLLYWLAALAGSVFWLRFILLVWMIGTVVVFFKLAQKLFKQLSVSLFLTLAFALLTSLPLFEGTITNAEHFFIGLVILGVYFFLEKRWLLSGLAVGLGFLFKSPPLFDWLALLFFSFFPVLAVPLKKKKIIIQAKKTFSLLLGFLGPTLLVFLFYAFKKGVLPFYLESVWRQNFPYLFSWGEGQGGNLFASPLFFRGLILLALLGIFLANRKRLLRTPGFLLVLIWFPFALFGALLSSRPYSHYLLQVIAPLVLLIGFLGRLLWGKVDWRLILLALLSVSLSVIAFFHYGFYTYPVSGYYQNFVQFILGKKAWPDYLNWFDGKTYRNYQVASFIEDFLPPGEPIFIWGNEPNIYALSRRLPVGRYAVAYHILDFNRQGEVMSDLEEELPGLVIYDLDFGHFSPELLAFLSCNQYYPIRDFDSLQVWHRFKQDKD
jgi:hypothetical protein